ncbi:Lon protease [Erwinia sp. OLTSP20]|uniref:S16 family serine protease n=1 Tax=unclassified Erwinia TaxID=2622719 RepID=UPI000C1867EF|nr:MULTISPECIES: Lon protease family protein [unclassified Erwinia]PIJ51352.1 Lon protease [Erwinia sp. OAMSP11]PIJ74136.1 Lon protease [Erwinia sp. OLSSP12]PIJ81574.1 Lon protease [Erwinia sp. OLCASP19]PIJ86099.1 Lon protease [Erwinia sp. OLMTSP26]PIJ87847.1 Lon protease [Erwinia sp. OLMDSP33]
MRPLFISDKSITLTSNKLDWQVLRPQTDNYQHFFSQLPEDTSGCFEKIQARLADGLQTFSLTTAQPAMMLVKIAEYGQYLTLLRDRLMMLQADKPPHWCGGHYSLEGNQARWRSVETAEDNFACLSGQVGVADWIEPEQLFGCVRIFRDNLTLEPGLLHRINGGTLIISLRAIISQPLMWLRLKQIFLSQQYIWLSPDETRALPVSVPAMPLTFRLLIAGDREALAQFQEMEAELSALAIYSEFEENIQIVDDEEMTDWCQWVREVANRADIGDIESDFWSQLIIESVRYTGDQETLPLCPCWLTRQLQDALIYSEDNRLAASQLKSALEARAWREGFLAERMQDEILLDQILIDTEGAVVGQINGLSVIEFPGHPRPFGEPSRISCVVHPGDGEFTDVERKAELGGNIHAKGMMIMQAWLVSELELEQQLPFSASIVFEQSYSEVDGDSASLAELCALISALANQPVNQQIAVTGSVDQFGNVQPVGGLNEKIEGFFQICQQRGLNGRQGVILPASNVRHLALNDDVINAVREEQFHLWTVSHIEQALPLLMDKVWNTERGPCLLRTIQERIAQMNQQENRHRPWPLRWLNWLHHN